MLWPYLKIWDWDLIFGRAVKVISSLGVRSSWSMTIRRVATRLTHTLLQRTLYSKETLCIVTSCSKEQFASNWLVTVCSLTHFTPQHTLPPGMFFSLEHFAPQPPLLPRTLFSSAQFASQHPLLLKTPCSSTHFAPQHTVLLRTLCSSAHFASKNILLLGTVCSSAHFASKNILLLGTLCSSELFTP